MAFTVLVVDSVRRVVEKDVVKHDRRSYDAPPAA
jgi:hypothetical protein